MCHIETHKLTDRHFLKIVKSYSAPFKAYKPVIKPEYDIFHLSNTFLLVKIEVKNIRTNFDFLKRNFIYSYIYCLLLDMKKKTNVLQQTFSSTLFSVMDDITSFLNLFLDHTFRCEQIFTKNIRANTLLTLPKWQKISYSISRDIWENI